MQLTYSNKHRVQEMVSSTFLNHSNIPGFHSLSECMDVFQHVFAIFSFDAYKNSKRSVN